MREDFAITPGLIYLNSANLSLCPRAVSEAIAKYREDFERNPTQGLREAWGKLWQSQVALATFLGARPEDLFLRANVTQVLNAFIFGFPLPAHSEILVGELEYGAIVNICRLRAQRESHAVRILKMPTTLFSMKSASVASLTDSVVSQLSPRTRLVVLSHVIGATGLVLPVREIARELRRRDIFFVVDGAYAPGALPVDFRELEEVDAYGCSLYKWMLGPKGTAFGWVSPQRQAQLQARDAGWASYDRPASLDAFGGKTDFQSRFLLSGCQDFAPFFAVRDSVAFWENRAPHLRARMATLRKVLTDSLTWDRWRSDDDAVNGPLLAFSLPARCQAQGPALAASLLETHGIQAHALALHGKWLVVLSPHVYNTETELERVIAALNALTPV